MVTNVLRIQVTVKRLDFAIESTIKPEIIATIHIIIYGKPDNNPFCKTIHNLFLKKYKYIETEKQNKSCHIIKL